MIEESALCLFCDQTRANHDQMRCDAIRSVLARRVRQSQQGPIPYKAQLLMQLKEIYRTLLEESRKITDVDLKISATGSQLSKRYQITPRGTSKPVHNF